MFCFYYNDPGLIWFKLNHFVNIKLNILLGSCKYKKLNVSYDFHIHKLVKLGSTSVAPGPCSTKQSSDNPSSSRHQARVDFDVGLTPDCFVDYGPESVSPFYRALLLTTDHTPF